jgi:diguanylate cyclase (GGDEF)-like protein
MRILTLEQHSEFADACLQNSPCGMLVVDDAGIVQRINRSLEEMLDISAERIQGKSLESLRNTVHKALLGEAGLLHLSGPGMTRERWLQCTVRQLGPMTGRYYLDVSELVQLREEAESLRQQVEELTITDELTGLANRRALNRALNTQVTRSRRYANPLSLAVIELRDESAPEARFDADTILTTSRYLRDRLRWVDLIARWDHNHFVVVLPETNAEDGRRLIHDISEGFDQVALPEASRQQSLSLRFGLAQWQKGNDSRLLMDRAAEDMNAGQTTRLTASAT